MDDKVKLPPHVAKWLDSVVASMDKNPDVIANAFALLDYTIMMQSIADYATNARNPFKRCLGKMLRSSSTTISVDGIESPSQEVLDWYQADVGDEGMLIATALLNGYEADETAI